MIGRLSSAQRFDRGRDYIVSNQGQYAENSLRLNTGQRLLNNYDQIEGSKDLIQVTGRLSHATKNSENLKKASTELELAESGLNSMKDILDQIKADALQGGSDVLAREDMEILGVQLRNLGENLYKIANTKLGDKYLFSGKQSNLKVVDFVANGLFDNANYKEGQTDLGERSIGGIQSSISLADIFSTTPTAASYTTATFTSPLGGNAEMNLVINDGRQNINVGDIAFAAGDTISTIVTKINTAFTNAGGSGSVVSQSGGKLVFTTSTVDDTLNNANSAIIISPGTNLPNSLSSLGLAGPITAQGVSGDIRTVLAKLDAAYNSDDKEGIRSAIIDIQQNIDRLINSQAKLGDLVKKFTDSETKNLEESENLKIQQSDIAKIPTVEAIQKVSLAKTVLDSSLQASAAMMQMNIFDFISI